MMKKFVCFLMSVFVMGTASAADPFTVSGVPVDATGATAITAQTKAISEGQALAAQVLIDRLTLESERMKMRFEPLDNETIARMIRALEISNEKRSSNRYLGDITVAFNPSQVQETLKSRGLAMISTQSRQRLVLPLLNGELWSLNGWSTAMQNRAFLHSLTPLRAVATGEGAEALISANQALAMDMAALRRVGERYGLAQVLIADARQSGAGVFVTLTDVALDSGQVRQLGSVSGADYDRAAWAVINTLESDWKNASVSLAESAEDIHVTVLYRSLNEWLSLQDVINGSAQIQDARLDALSKDGAMMTLTYGGDMNRLRNELAFKGVDIREDPALGVVLSRTSRF